MIVIVFVWFVVRFILLLSSTCMSSFLLYFEFIAISLVFYVCVLMGLQMSKALLYIYSVNVLAFLIVLWGVVIKKEVLLVISFFLKLRFFPFVWWFPYISDQVNLVCFFLVGLLKKVFPLVLIYVKNSVSGFVFVVFVYITAFISLVNLCLNQNNIKLFLAWSSKIKFSIVIMIMHVNWVSGLVYLVLYVVMVMFFLSCLSEGVKS